ncbi:carbamoyl-phosphate-synthetase [Halovibrio salipaludis]|uniref:Carbamoyl-phosphate-synthetase n=1 Tax=Halovibrio salipaludis TaxID=2032626 RepID=A0A2A2EZU9_9GAMM|nr:carbamoyl-phosphate-synthetase [Halovibrio salipaludis]
MQKVMFLGAAPMQMPPIEYASEKGYEIITVDYKPDNPGHRLADRWYDCSTTDLDGVLEIAREEAIDGIVAYASDPAAPTAAYVGNAMGLPSNPYESVCTLAEKDKFRAFLHENGFNVPEAQSFTNISAAAEFAKSIRGNVFTKPVDSSGSKGVTRVTNQEQFKDAFEYAAGFSRSGRVIVESELVRDGYQVAGDGFVRDGRLAFRCWANEHFDYQCNGLVPIGESFPSILPDRLLNYAHAETQRLLELLDMRSGALNFDFIFTQDEELYFLEIGPRNGGNLIPQVIRYGTGVDLIAATVEAALGNDYELPANAPFKGYWASYIIHALTDGSYGQLNVSERMQSRIVEQDLWKQPGDPVKLFRGSNDTVGTMILRFQSAEEMCALMDDMNTDIFVECL